MLRRRRALALLLALGGCSRREPAATGGDAHAADASASTDASTSTDASPSTDASTSADASPSTDASASTSDDDDYLSALPKVAKGIGHTSVVFKLELSTGKKAAFKPASRRGPLRYKGEIAARRLGVALALPNVPRAFFRAMDAKALATAAANGPPEAAELLSKEAIVRGDVVKGALMPWIDGLTLLALEREPLASQWKVWLRKGEAIPDDQRALAAQISTLIAFDFVTGNWDRWSGGNVGIDKASGTLLFIDNDGAFFDVPPTDALQKNKRLLQGVDRFSKSFVTHLRALDDAAFTAAIGEESRGVSLLSKKALDGALQRKKQVLEIIDAKQAAAESDALSFP